MVRGRPVRASTVAATKASLALSTPFGRVKNTDAPSRKFTHNGSPLLNAVACDALAMKHRARRMRQPRKSLVAKTTHVSNEQTITNYFPVKVKSNAVNDLSFDVFTPLHIASGSDRDADEEDAESDDAMQQFNGFEYSAQISSNAVIKRPKFNASGSLSTDYDDDDDDDEDDGSGSSHCGNTANQNSIQTTNIFLQKPVLHLNIDKSPNQPSSIVINKHLDVVPNFTLNFAAFNNSISRRMTNDGDVDDDDDDDDIDTSVAINTAQTNNNHNPNNNDCTEPQAADKERKRKSFGAQQMHAKLKRTKRLSKRANGSTDSGLIDALIHSDSNSCDSGVVVDSSTNANDTAKPTTPHRIVCPSTSPVKHFNDSQQSITDHQPPNTSSSPKIRGKLSKRKLNAHESENLLKYAVIRTCEAHTSSESIIIVDDDSDQSASETTIKVESTSESDSDVKPIKIESNIDVSVAARSPTPALKSKCLTDYFPVRRSIRKTKRAVEQEHLRHIEIAIEKQSEDGLVVKWFKDKGRGICAGRPFARGEFVVEYIGDLIEQSEADRREEIYAKNSSVGCYMYYFKHKEQQWCIDATAETGKLGRLVNHSRNGNLATKTVTYKNRPHLVLIAKEDIKEGEEVTYDYGDRTRESLMNHPWLAL